MEEPGLFGGGDEAEKGPTTSDGARPLADRMRPASFDKFIGQTHVVGPGKPLRKLIEEDRFGSMIFWGPPGTGKTTLARISANVSGRAFIRLSAVETGVKELKDAIAGAKYNASNGKKTVLFIDELHRYNKTQQDQLLPHVETGLVTLVGATTENPSFGVIPALRSRCTVVELKPLSHDEICAIVAQAAEDVKNGLGGKIQIASNEVFTQIALFASGDARVALGLLEACHQADDGGGVTKELVEKISQKASLLYDRAGQSHYDHASAFQKSLRGSDPDAAIYWMARMLEAGEDPRFIARRLMVTAAEDVGNADPTAFILAVSAANAVEKLGLPEGRIPLAQAVLYVACAPKSNSAVVAVDAALEYVRQSGGPQQPPAHLRDSSYSDAKKMGHGKGYKYPHDFPDHWVQQSYLPDGMEGIKFYTPSKNGREATFEQKLREIKKGTKD
ncbi:MAG: replication-associated recombination protein A [Nitrospinae bacterium]|nr:replication-associated recombination protein A [Nitrospinota bacterium]